MSIKHSIVHNFRRLRRNPRGKRIAKSRDIARISGQARHRTAGRARQRNGPCRLGARAPAKERPLRQSPERSGRACRSRPRLQRSPDVVPPRNAAGPGCDGARPLDPSTCDRAGAPRPAPARGRRLSERENRRGGDRLHRHQRNRRGVVQSARAGARKAKGKASRHGQGACAQALRACGAFGI